MNRSKIIANVQDGLSAIFKNMNSNVERYVDHGIASISKQTAVMDDDTRKVCEMLLVGLIIERMLSESRQTVNQTIDDATITNDERLARLN